MHLESLPCRATVNDFTLLQSSKRCVWNFPSTAIHSGRSEAAIPQAVRLEPCESSAAPQLSVREVLQPSTGRLELMDSPEDSSHEVLQTHKGASQTIIQPLRCGEVAAAIPHWCIWNWFSLHLCGGFDTAANLQGCVWNLGDCLEVVRTSDCNPPRGASGTMRGFGGSPVKRSGRAVQTHRDQIS